MTAVNVRYIVNDVLTFSRARLRLLPATACDQEVVIALPSRQWFKALYVAASPSAL